MSVKFNNIAFGMKRFNNNYIDINQPEEDQRAVLSIMSQLFTYRINSHQKRSTMKYSQECRAVVSCSRRNTIVYVDAVKA